jgi:hypothetical protein
MLPANTPFKVFLNIFPKLGNKMGGALPFFSLKFAA